MFLFRRNHGPLFHFIVVGVGIALIIFALLDTTVSRLVLVVGGIAIVVGLARGVSSTRRDSNTSAPHR